MEQVRYCAWLAVPASFRCLGPGPKGHLQAQCRWVRYTSPFECLEQHVFLVSYMQIQHVLRWSSFYLVSRPIALGDWLCVAWVLAHTLIMVINALLLVAKSAAFGDKPRSPASAAATAASAAPTVLTHCDPRVTQGTQVRMCQSDISDSNGELRASPGISTLSRTTCSCAEHMPESPSGSARAPAFANVEPPPSATALSTAAAPSRKTAPIFIPAVRCLLAAWSVLREPLLLVASPCKCGFASLVYLCGWLAARGVGVGAARRRWLLLSAYSNGLTAARYPHLVALLVVLSAICQHVSWPPTTH